MSTTCRRCEVCGGRSGLRLVRNALGDPHHGVTHEQPGALLCVYCERATRLRPMEPVEETLAAMVNILEGRLKGYLQGLLTDRPPHGRPTGADSTPE